MECIFIRNVVKDSERNRFDRSIQFVIALCRLWVPLRSANNEVPPSFVVGEV